MVTTFVYESQHRKQYAPIEYNKYTLMEYKSIDFLDKKTLTLCIKKIRVATSHKGEAHP
jgi:hypothetical protein